MSRSTRAPVMIVTLGMQGSGSTWIYNVVRRLIEVEGIAVNCLSTESGVELLDNLVQPTQFTLIKAHGLDLRLLRLAALSNARFIMSVRDPRDSAVSQIERFGATLGEAAADLSRALVSMAMLPSEMPRLLYYYEDRFMDRPKTICQIARFLGLPARRRDVASIFGSLRPVAVRHHLTTGLPTVEGEQRQDPVTLWNPNHLGDGRVGKWRDRLQPREANAVAAALTPFTPLWRHQTICWSSELFLYDLPVGPGCRKHVPFDGVQRVLVHGPNLHLPAGRWRVLLDVSLPESAAICRRYLSQDVRGAGGRPGRLER